MPKQTNLPVTANIARFDFIVLKPTHYFMLLQAGISLYSHAWINGLILAVGAFSMGFVGANLHKNLSFVELADGNPNLSDAMSNYSSPADYGPITSASLQLGLILGLVVASVLGFSYGWLVRIGALLGIWWLGGIYIAVLFGLIESLYVRGKLRSIAIGVVAYGLGICLILLVVFGAIKGFHVLVGL
jgi:hypothetical protein